MFLKRIFRFEKHTYIKYLSTTRLDTLDKGVSKTILTFKTVVLDSCYHSKNVAITVDKQEVGITDKRKHLGYEEFPC